MNCDWCGERVDFDRYYCMYLDSFQKRTFHNTQCLLRWVSNELGEKTRHV